MKILNLRKFVVLVSFVLLAFQMSMAQEAKKTEKAVIKTSISCDHCKECETCGKNFQTELLKMKGIKMYELDEKLMTITVYYNPQKTNLQAIKTAITHLGYDADELKADVASYEKLDDCCKKV